MMASYCCFMNVIKSVIKTLVKSVVELSLPNREKLRVEVEMSFYTFFGIDATKVQCIHWVVGDL